eukprot:CAMPEP_0195289920 /NCGR_PEP_ID=MMETSP0707-20130614/5994_1 /TAXON_ID=33640 /ORGANISM="Asterionellopsis glacialis, Strain CCMP134" /LENGTH=519 /DNA_ID=CAMNT_0040349979 /DNA_START=178 /DNA_END=1737 /DNA_ORIENTATION=+
MSYNMGGQMNNRSMLWERIRIQIEIACETVTDLLGGSGGICRKPLVLFAGIALFMTMRSAKRGIGKMKRAGYTSTGMGYGTYGSTGGYGSGGAGGYGTSRTGGLGGSSLSGLGGTTGGYGQSALGRSTTGGTYGTSSSLGGSTTGYGASSYGTGTGAASAAGGLRGSTTGTARLADTHGQNLRVLENDMFKDYGQIQSFGGQVETLQAYEGAGVVEKVLQSPGNGKVLIVDGGGNLRSAILDGTGASAAQRNGWAGIIVNGAIRNADTIATTPIGVKALGTNPIKGTATQGSKGSAITIGGAQISSGMWVHADKDGIVVSNQQLSSGGTSAMGVGGISAVGGASTGYGTGTNNFGGGTSIGGTGIGGTGIGGTTMGGTTMGGTTVGGTTVGGTGTAMGGTSGYGAVGGTTGYGANTGMGSTNGYGGTSSGGYGATNGYGSNTGGYGTGMGGAQKPGGLSSLFGTKSSSGYGGSMYGSKKSSYDSYGGGGYGSQRRNSKMMRYIGFIALVMFVYSFISPN